MIVLISGRSGSGKTTVVNTLIKIIGREKIAYLHQDSYYKDQSHIPYEQRERINYDHPDTIELDLFAKHLKLLLEGKAIKKPVYNYISHTREHKVERVEPKEIIIADGIHTLTNPVIRELSDIKVFVDVAKDICFIRRLLRDIKERGRSVESVINQYLDTVRPMQEEFVSPGIKYVDYIIKDGGYNLKSIQELAEIIINQINKNE